MMGELTSLLRGAPEDLRAWLEQPSSAQIRLSLLTIIVGFGCYGLTIGLWRAPLMGGFVALKMPALILITLACNGFLNGMIGLLLGSGLGFRQSLQAQLLSFAVAAMILGTLAPVTFFMSLNAPEPDAANATTAHSSFLITHTLLIAYAGIMANVHLGRLLLATTSNAKTTGLTIAAWIGGNAFVGAQFSWILRPFFGTPSIEVAFLRDDPFQGTFYETVWRSLEIMTKGHSFEVLMLIILSLFILHLPLLRILTEQKPEPKPIAS